MTIIVPSTSPASRRPRVLACIAASSPLHSTWQAGLPTLVMLPRPHIPIGVTKAKTMPPCWRGVTTKELTIFNALQEFDSDGEQTGK